MPAAVADGVVALLLAAGSGTRFARIAGGPDGAKLLAPVDGARRVIDRAIAAIAPHCDHIVAAVGANPGVEAALREHAGLTVVRVADPARGMGHSLASAARAARHLSPRWLIVMLADMPFVRADTVGSLLARANATDDAASIVAPRWRGQRGHPVVFGRAQLTSLVELDGDRGASPLLGRHPVVWVDVDDPGVVRDVDEPDDLETRAGQSGDAPC